MLLAQGCFTEGRRRQTWNSHSCLLPQPNLSVCKLPDTQTASTTTNTEPMFFFLWWIIGFRIQIVIVYHRVKKNQLFSIIKNPNTEQWCIKTIYTEKAPAVSDPIIYGLIRNIFSLISYLSLPCQYSASHFFPNYQHNSHYFDSVTNRNLNSGQ